MKKRKIFRIILASIFVFLFSFVVVNSKKETTLQVSNQDLVDNKKIEWGIKRCDNHLQPDLGSLNKQLIDEVKGIAMGNNQSKYVYLSFDEGYEAGHTKRILETLKQNNVKATFFITAHYLNTSEELVKQMIDDGHIVGNHTVNHKSMPTLTDDELKKEIMDLHTAVHEKFGYEMKYLRPPKGEYSKRTLKNSQNLGYTTVMWSLAYDDWDEKKQGRTEYAKKKILDNIHNGAVILLHPNSSDNTQILDYCIKEIKNMGYEIKSLNEFER